MIEQVWIAFACGLFLGSIVAILSLGLVSINRDTRLRDTIWENEDRIKELETTRQLLKEEIFRLSKNYKPRKPQPRHRRRKPVKVRNRNKK